MTTTRLALALLATLALSPFASGCTVASGGGTDESEHDQQPTEDGRETESVRPGVDCSNRRVATGYRSGSAFTIHIVDADGKPIEEATASMYQRMQDAAAKAGVTLRIVSGFRTMAQQQALYDDYIHGRGNLAAKPGYSNHQSGHALDLNTSGAGVYSWLENHADEYGFKRTVPSEIWHWEYWGAEVGGSCTSSAPPPPSSSGCYSNTLGREVVVNTCVQSKSDSKWYQCLAGNKWEIRWNVAAACVSEHPL